MQWQTAQHTQTHTYVIQVIHEFSYSNWTCQKTSFHASIRRHNVFPFIFIYFAIEYSDIPIQRMGNVILRIWQVPHRAYAHTYTHTGTVKVLILFWRFDSLSHSRSLFSSMRWCSCSRMRTITHTHERRMNTFDVRTYNRIPLLCSNV